VDVWFQARNPCNSGRASTYLASVTTYREWEFPIGYVSLSKLWGPSVDFASKLCAAHSLDLEPIQESVRPCPATVSRDR
jgi:hypothetical protein